MTTTHQPTAYTVGQTLDLLQREGYETDDLVVALAAVIEQSALQQTEDGRDLLTEYELDLVRDQINPRVTAPFINRDN